MPTVILFKEGKKMKFILTKKQFDFLITLDNVNNFILKHSFENNNAIFFVDDISSFQDIIYFNVVEYGMDKEGADFRACKNYGPLYK